MTDRKKKFFLDQHGCAKNQVDAELMMSRLFALGWEAAAKAEDASLIIINSCGFIESAKKESLEAVFSAKKNHPKAKLLLSGCLAERYAESFKTDLPEADGIFGNGNLSYLDELIAEMEKDNRPVKRLPQKGICEGERKTLLGFPSSAYIKITEGCNNCCSFCAIPLIRGSLRSRPISSIVNEIKDFQKRGLFEFNLIGQDLAAYGRDGIVSKDSAAYVQEPSPLFNLLKSISALDGDFWLRLLYIHPDHFPRDILPILQNDGRILPYFDIPFQSGDDSILRAMNRCGSFALYKKLVEDIRFALPTAVLRTTFLCGFPGETDEAAENSLRFLETVQAHWSGCFTYSREEDTPAAAMKNQVSGKTAKNRAQKLQEAQERLSAEKLTAYVGTRCTVLVEEVIKKTETFDSEEKEGSFALGRAWFQAPEVDGVCVIQFDKDNATERKAVFPGSRVNLKITGVRGIDLVGVLV